MQVPFEDEGSYVVVKHAALVTSTFLAEVLKVRCDARIDGRAACGAAAQSNGSCVPSAQRACTVSALARLSPPQRVRLPPSLHRSPSTIAAHEHDALLLLLTQSPNVKLFNATAAEDLVVKPDDDLPGGK